MTGTTRLLYTLTALAGLGLHAQDLSAVSGANCTFKQNPAKFQGQTQRAIRAINDQLSALDKTGKAMSANVLSTLDPTASRRLYAKAYATAVADAPAIWLYEPRMVLGISSRIRTAGIRSDAWWNSLADWSVLPGKEIARDRVVR